MRVISNYPSGFLSLLGMQNFGDTPKQLADQVAPVVDLLELYGANLTTAIAGINTSVLGAGFEETAVVVPNGETWGLLTMAAAVSCEAGVVMDFCPAVTLPVLSTYRAFLANFVQCPASTTKSNVAILPSRLWLPSGTKLGVYCQNITGAPTGATSAEVNCVYIRLKS